MVGFFFFGGGINETCRCPAIQIGLTGEGNQHPHTLGLRETEPDHDPRKRDPPSHANSDEVNRTTADYSNPPCKIKPPKETAGLLLQPELPNLKRVFLIRVGYLAQCRILRRQANRGLVFHFRLRSRCRIPGYTHFTFR